MKSRKSGIIPVLLAALLWGTMGLFVRYFKALGLGVEEIVFIRIAVGAAAFSATMLIKDRSAFKLKLGDIWCFVGTGLVSLLFFTLCYFKTITLASLSTAAILLYTAPVFVVLLSALFFKERLTGQKLVACALAVAGCALVSGLGNAEAKISFIALLCGLGSGIGYALYSVFGRFALDRSYSPLTISAYTFLFALAGALPLADFKQIAVGFSNRPEAWAMLAAMGIVTAFLPYLLYTKGLSMVEPGKASITACAEPVVAALIGAAVFHERMSLSAAAGVAVVLAALVLLNVKLGKLRANPVNPNN